MDNIALSQMLSVKICHDLAGLAGAVNNGTEIFAESSDEMKARSFELIETSAKDMITRIILFRKAFGTSAPNAECDLAAFQKNILNYAQQKKIDIHWKYEQDILHINSRLTQILANLVIIASDTLMIGGKLTVAVKNLGKSPTISVIGRSPQFKIPPAMISLFHYKNTNDETPSHDPQQKEECTTRNVVCFYLQGLLEKAAFRLTVSEGGERFEFLAE